MEYKYYPKDSKERENLRLLWEYSCKNTKLFPTWREFLFTAEKIKQANERGGTNASDNLETK